MTVEEALRGAPTDRREARLLLAAASGVPEAALVAFPERSLLPEAEKRFAEFVQRRSRGEPVAYLLGCKEFYGLDLVVSPAVLIPRPETELLVELALTRPFSSVADLGTGSGAIALALKANRPSGRVVAVESSVDAFAVARTNAVRHRLDVDLRQGHWCEPLGEERFDLVVSNPPYIASGDPHLGALAFEPARALVAGADGLDCIREIVASAPAHIEPGGWLLLEHGMGQDEAVRALLLARGLEDVRSWPDLAGIPRVTGGRVK